MAECLFCRIGQGDSPAHIVAETDTLLAFLDLGQIRPGHTMIIPKAHYDYFDDLPADLATEIITMGQQIARAQKALTGAPRVAFFFTGGDIPHVHAHVTPMMEKTDITSRRYIAEEKLTFRPLPSPGDDVLGAQAEKLRNALANG